MTYEIRTLCRKHKKRKKEKYTLENLVDTTTEKNKKYDECTKNISFLFLLIQAVEKK